MKIGFIGCGNMGQAMIKGIVEAKWIQNEDILVSNRTSKKLEKIKDLYGVSTTTDNCVVAKNSDILVLSVKPKIYSLIIEEIRDVVKADTLIVSIAPGITLHQLETQFIQTHKIVRCMPNTPAMVNEGCTAYVMNANCDNTNQQIIEKLLSCFGIAASVDESLMDAVTGLSGSSPAFVYMFIEALADGAVHEGMPREMAYQFAAQTVLGSAKLVLASGNHPGICKDQVCSPAGTTIEGVRTLEADGFRSSVMEAVIAASRKSKGE